MSAPKRAARPAARVDMAVRIGPLELRNPVLTASGTFGYGDEYAHVVDLTAIGGVITKTVTVKPRAGNPPQRIAETAGGMLNSIGLENVGLARFASEKVPRLRALGATIVASVGGETARELERLVGTLARVEGIAAFEINFSCPNVAAGGARYWAVPRRLERTLARLRPLTTRALIAKLSPDVTSVGDLARACEAGGADAVTAVNTFVGMALDLDHLRPRLARRTGGLSGPAIKPLALARCHEAAHAVRIPVIGSGGIMNGRDALEYLADRRRRGAGGHRDLPPPARRADHRGRDGGVARGARGALARGLARLSGGRGRPIGRARAARGAEPPHRPDAAPEPEPRVSDLAIAFDVATLEQALELDRRLGAGPEYAKVGLQLFTAAGPEAVLALRARGRRVFLDLKLHDIPHTVEGAAAAAARLGADLLTVHATGGAAMIGAAARGIAAAGGTTGIVAVTLLTSLDPADLPPGFARPFALHQTLAALLALSERAGARGIVCAASDLEGVRRHHPAAFFAVTPGIRPAGGATHDQSRVATIREAVLLGSSLLVLGRAVTAAADPRAALEAARAERDAALVGRPG